MVANLFLIGLVVLAAAGHVAVAAELNNTDADFPIKANRTLKVEYKDPNGDSEDEEPHQIMTPGETWAKSDVQSAPIIGGEKEWGNEDVVSDRDKGILLMLDSDVPQKDHRTTYLHWFAKDVQLTDPPFEADIPADSQPKAEYKPPAPPAGDVAHAYTFLLFKQPEPFALNDDWAKQVQQRTNFDVVRFVKENGLDEQALGANYLRVKNQASATVSFPPARATGDEKDPTIGNGGGEGEKKQGGAVGVKAERAMLGVMVGAAVLAVGLAFGL